MSTYTVKHNINTVSTIVTLYIHFHLRQERYIRNGVESIATPSFMLCGYGNRIHMAGHVAA